jgi:hypothetical protein
VQIVVTNTGSEDFALVDIIGKLTFTVEQFHRRVRWWTIQPDHVAELLATTLVANRSRLGLE